RAADVQYANHRLQPRPEADVGLLAIAHDSARPRELDSLPAHVSHQPENNSVAREEAEAQLLQRLIDDPGEQHVRLDLGPGFARGRLERADLVAGAAVEARHQRAVRAVRPPPGSPGSSLWPTCQVLITRCCPKVRAMNEPSSTICAALKCSPSAVHTASSAPSGCQTSMLVYRSAAFWRAVKRSDASNFSRSA